MILVVIYYSSALSQASRPTYLLWSAIEMMMYYGTLLCFNVFNRFVLADRLIFRFKGELAIDIFQLFIVLISVVLISTDFLFHSRFCYYISISCVKNCLLIFNILRLFFKKRKPELLISQSEFSLIVC